MLIKQYYQIKLHDRKDLHAELTVRRNRMGFLSSMLGGVVGDQLLPYLKAGMNMNASALERKIEGEERLLFRAAYLLAMIHKSTYKAKEIYESNKNQYDKAFGQMYGHRQFKTAIDEFHRRLPGY